MVTIKSKKEIELMKEACRVVALTYKELEKHIKPGISTLELDQIAEKMMAKHYSTVEDDKMSRLSGVMKDEVTDNLQIEFEDVEEATLEDINLAFVKEKESLEAEERKNAENGDLNNGGTV